MKNNTVNKVKVPISLKLVLIFSMLVVLALSLTTIMVSYLVRNDERIKAEENNHTLNGRTAETIQSAILNAQGNTNGYLNSLLVIGQDKNFEEQSQLLFDDFCERNASCCFIYSSEIGIKVNPNFGKTHGDITEPLNKWIEKNSYMQNRVKDGIIEVINTSALFKTPMLSILFPHYNSITEQNDFVFIGLDVENLAELMSSSTYNSSFLINRDGELLIHPDEQKMMENEDLSSLSAVRAMRTSSAQNSQFLLPDENGKMWFYAYHRIIGDMYVITCVSEQDVFETINRTTYRIILLSLAVIFLSIIIIRLFSKSLTSPIGELVNATKTISAGTYELELKPRTKDEIGYLTGNFIEMADGLAERERLMSTFTKFTNKFIAEKASKGELTPGGERKNATIFFSDIRSFTALSEKLTPDEVVEFLNEYFARMCECVDKTNGVVDKFIGDAVMAVWGAPETSGSPQGDAWNAIKAALMMRIALYHFNQKRQKEGKNPIKIGCGINSGPIVAGQIGSEGHMNYTVIGDTVNLASRTEALNKPFATDILITENTYELIKDKIIVEEMPGVHVKGKTDPIKMYAVVNAKGVKGPEDIHELREFLGWEEPDLGKVSTDEEEKKYKIDG